MTKENFPKWMLYLAAMLGFLGGAMFVSAQAPTSTSDADQISHLLACLSNHSKAPSDVLDPVLSVPEREKNLGHFSSSSYELSIVPTSGVPVISGNAATLPVHVHYDAGDGNSLDTGATAQFVKRGDAWYFANYDFMNWPVVLIIVLVVGLSIGIAYAATVLVLRSRLVKRGPLGANVVRMFIPLFWPSLFRQTRYVGLDTSR